MSRKVFARVYAYDSSGHVTWMRVAVSSTIARQELEQRIEKLMKSMMQAGLHGEIVLERAIH